MATVDVLVAGAGPVGLTLAAELLRQGVTCRIVDRLEQPSPYCRALGVQSRTLEILDRLGLVEKALDSGLRMLAANTWREGQRVQHMALDWEALPDIPFPMFLSLEQNRTEEILTGHLQALGGRVERGVSLTGLDQGPAGVRAALSTGEAVECRFLVGCDGAHSTVRKALDIPYEGEAYPDTYLLADVDVEGPLAPEESHRFLLDGEVLMAVPIRGTRRFRFSTREPGEEASTGDGLEHGLILGEAQPPTVQEMQALVDRFAGPGIRLVNCRWTSRYRISRRLAARYRQGRVFLAGDSAHIHPPTGGQGMNTGIQDAWNLAWKLALAVRGQATEDLLDSYEAERRRVGQEILGRTDKAFRAPGGMTGEEPPDLEAARQLLIAWAQLDLDYRGTPLVEQVGEPEAPVQAGDRAPDGRLVDHRGEAVRLFDLFRPPGHHLLLFSRGDLPPAAGADLAARVAAHHGERVRAHVLLETGSEAPPGLDSVYFDPGNAVGSFYGITRTTAVLVRPDGYLGFRSAPPAGEALLRHLERLFGRAAL